MITELEKDIIAGREVLFKCGEATYWEWSAGSRLIFWRWQKLFQKEARDGIPICISDTLPEYHHQQKWVSNQLQKKLITEKFFFIHQVQESQLHPVPLHPNDSVENTIPKWITESGKATLFLPTMKRPKRGYLRQKPTQEWEFIPGMSKTATTVAIPLPDFEPQVFHLIDTFQLYEGYKRFNSIKEDHAKLNFHREVARHVSAAGLENLSTPTLSKHSQMSPNDKAIWDAAYKEEYMGLHQEQKAWSYITEDEYKVLCKSFDESLLPTMAITTIKYDKKGLPKRAKYRIVALGNLDPMIGLKISVLPQSYHIWNYVSSWH